MPAAAFLPSPISDITIAAPVTMSSAAPGNGCKAVVPTPAGPAGSCGENGYRSGQWPEYSSHRDGRCEFGDTLPPLAFLNLRVVVIVILTHDNQHTEVATVGPFYSPIPTPDPGPISSPISIRLNLPLMTVPTLAHWEVVSRLYWVAASTRFWTTGGLIRKR
jgi:hypothetical protein